MSPFYARKAANDEVLAWVNGNLARHIKRTGEEKESEIEHIIDYLNSDAAPKRLQRMSYIQAKTSARKWGITQSRKGKDIVEVEGDTTSLMEFADGFRFVRLVTQNAYAREGHYMDHCVRSYFGKAGQIYSLRDAANKPHCTIESWAGVQQIRGKGNGRVHHRYKGYVIEFLRKLDETVRESEMEQLGYASLGNAYIRAAARVYGQLPSIVIGGETWLDANGAAVVRPYDRKKVEAAIARIPGDPLKTALILNHLELATLMIAMGLKVESALDLGGSAITELPDNLTVKGYLNIQGTGITSLPENLDVCGLSLGDTAITVVPASLTVSNFFDLQGSSVTSLPDNLTVGGALDLSWTKITILPENLSVGDYLNLRGTAISVLPDSLRVGDSICIGSTDITLLPDNFTIAGSLSLKDTKITELREGLVIDGSLNLEGSLITELPYQLTVQGSLTLQGSKVTSLPDMLTVRDSLDMEGTEITSLPDNLYVGLYLMLQGSKITKLPENLTVGCLDLKDTAITELPATLKILHSLNINPAMKEVPVALRSKVRKPAIY